MGFRWKVTLGDGSVQYPVSAHPVNGLPKIQTLDYVKQLPIQISHPSDMSSVEIGYEIVECIRQNAWIIWNVSHGKSLQDCIATLQVLDVSTSQPVYMSSTGNPYCISHAVLVFQFRPGYGDDVNDAQMAGHISSIRERIDSHLNDIWPRETTLVTLLGGV